MALCSVNVSAQKVDTTTSVKNDTLAQYIVRECFDIQDKSILSKTTFDGLGNEKKSLPFHVDMDNRERNMNSISFSVPIPIKISKKTSNNTIFTDIMQRVFFK